jgi:hypothetical protein
MAAGPERPAPSRGVGDRRAFSAIASAARQVIGCLGDRADGHARVAHGEAEIDRLLEQLSTVRQMPQRVQRLLEAGDRLAMRRASGRRQAGLRR